MSGPQGGGDGGGRGSKRAGAAPDLPAAAAARGQREGGGRSTALRELAWRQMRHCSARRPLPACPQHISAALLLGGSSHLAALAPDAAADDLSDSLVVTREAALSSIHATSDCGSAPMLG